MRTFAITLHADEGFTPLARALITKASGAWRDASNGRIKIDVEYDVNFGDLESVEAHKAANESFLIPIFGDGRVAERIDEALGGPGKQPVAATLPSKGPGDPTVVFLILDRIGEEEGSFFSVVTHEFGHVAGLPDLPALGSIMSAGHVKGEPPVRALTVTDRELCRGAGLCD